MEALKKKITCQRLLTIIGRALTAGHLDEKGRRIYSNVGTPQGSVMAPILANIVLHELDKHIEGTIKKSFERGEQRKANKEYMRLAEKIKSRNKKKDPKERQEILEKMREMPTLDTQYPNFKRMQYIRYADDFVVLVTGTKKDAIEICEEIKKALAGKCGLNLNMEKTQITNAREGFMFLGA